jgi:hypothetical protein
MWNFLRKSLHAFIPSNFHDPVGLAMRLIRSKDPVALFAMETALLGGLLLPLDLLLQIAEKRLYQRAPKPKLPLIFVCGPPRSGTTLVAQTLIGNLPVCYLNNLTAVFPRSPIMATRLFEKFIGKKEITYKSYYGKSLHFSGPNDALYIWDRWFGKDRARVPGYLSDSQKRDMIQFFGAYEQAFQMPLVNKNNALNTCAGLVAEVLENSYFLCLTRDPAYLAQSLLVARTEIHGDLQASYGVENPNKPKDQDTDYIEDICAQVQFHEQKIKEQQQIIGPERFWVISYEKFCEKPEELVKRVSDQILGQPVQIEKLKEILKPFRISNKVRVESEVFEKIKQTLQRKDVFFDKQKQS